MNTSLIIVLLRIFTIVALISVICYNLFKIGLEVTKRQYNTDNTLEVLFKIARPVERKMQEDINNGS
jgi:hypothetical protein